MASERIVIVGAGPAGLSTARAYRECGGQGEVTLVGEERMLPYRRPPLTKEFLRGELDSSELPIEPGEWFAANDVQLLLGSRVTAIDPQQGTVTLHGYVQLLTDAIVLATGAQPARPSIPGIEHANVRTLRSLPDSEGIRTAGDPGGHATVIGTGFIGCEAAASLAMRGADVTLIGEERLPQLGRLGQQAAQRIAGWLEDLGIELIGQAHVSAVHHGHTVELDDGRHIGGAPIVLATGVAPRAELAKDAGLQVSGGAVVVDETMRSPSTEGHVLAVGDLACAFNASAQRHLRVEHWGDALGHGEVAGRTLAAGDGRWESVPGFWSAIGDRVLKYAAWGDGYDESRLVEGADGSFTVWYGRANATVGVLCHERDDDYERGRELIAAGAPTP
ncbi:MAG TPA: FAD-dependent oxidoreductase [Solirubrobacteraceae bacterium]|jgi:NADPH-dependent 2,4-dienoyl-CoA reductase/sulfur reductase-like enzyme|nr:FAD-dependent oxidoreductase [Solirubrobacteraceae bacterium]